MTKRRENQLAVHCIKCGKNFFADTKPVCGGIINGHPMCRVDDIKRAQEDRLVVVKADDAAVARTKMRKAGI